jgi:hypothetical protein
MDNITIITDAQGKEHVLEEFAPNEFRSTPKEIWDEQQKAAELGGTL